MVLFHKLQQDMSFLSSNHETEVKLRLQFEAKLNNLHSLHRDLNSKYNRATEEIYGLEEIQKYNLQNIDEQKKELIMLRSVRIDQETKLAVQDEKIRIQENLITEKMKKISDLEQQVGKLNEEVDVKQLKLKEVEQVVNQMKLKIEAAEAINDNRLNEIHHLEMQLKENKELKQKYFDKSEEVQIKQQELYKQLNAIQRDKVAIDEIKRDRDDRIVQLRAELDSLNRKYDDLNKNHSALNVKYES